jgi:hypothetical protein
MPRSSYLIINLALSDLLVLLSMPLEIMDKSIEYAIESNFLCKESFKSIKIKSYTVWYNFQAISVNAK